MSDMLQQFGNQLAAFGPRLLGGLAVLVLGWLVALVAAFLVRKGLSKVSVDNKLAQWVAGPEASTQLPIESWASRTVFYVVMLFVVIAFLQTVQLTVVTEPLNELVQPLMAYLPHFLAGALLAIAAWVVATVLKKITVGACKAMKLDEKLGGKSNGEVKKEFLSGTFAELVYWLVFLLFLPSILEALRMDALLAPVTTLLNKVFDFLPNIVSAVAIGAVGWFIARIIQRLLQSLLASAGVDRLSEKWGLAASLGKQTLSGVIALVVYFLILVPVLISALDALKIEALTRPASDMLGKIMAVMPDIFGALVVILLAVVIGKVVAGIITNLLAGLGFNNVLVKLGLAKQAPQGNQAPCVWVGRIAFMLIVLLACVNASDMLGLPSVGVLIKDFLVFAGHVLAGVAILGLGLLLARIIGTAISASDSPNARRLALLARVVIVALAGAMALRQTGLANEIVNLAFGLTLGAVAIAAALAFGLGGRDTAARALEEWRGSPASRREHEQIITKRI